MVYWINFTVPIWLPTSGWIAFWLVCGGFALIPMSIFFIRENSHRAFVGLAYWDREEPIGMSAAAVTKIVLAGPITLILGLIVTFHDQTKRHSREIALNESRRQAYLSGKTIDADI